MKATPLSLAATAIASNEIGDGIDFALTVWDEGRLEGIASILDAQSVLHLHARAKPACIVHDEPGSLGQRAIRVAYRIHAELQRHAVIALYDRRTKQVKIAGSHPQADRSRASVELSNYWTCQIGHRPHLVAAASSRRVLS